MYIKLSVKRIAVILIFTLVFLLLSVSFLTSMHSCSCADGEICVFCERHRSGDTDSLSLRAVCLPALLLIVLFCVTVGCGRGSFSSSTLVSLGVKLSN